MLGNPGKLGSDGLNELAKRWRDQWPAVVPAEPMLARYSGGVLLDFHVQQTPSRRVEYPLQYAEILFRCQTVLHDLVALSESSVVFVVTRSWSASATEPAARDPLLEHFLPSEYWQTSLSDLGTVGDPTDPPRYEHLFIRTLSQADPRLNSVMLLAADGQASNAVVFGADVSWILSLCDEGCHLLSADTVVAETLTAAHSEWLAVVGDLPTFDCDQSDSPEWQVAFDWLSEGQARDIVRLIEQGGVLGTSSRATAVDPRREMTMRLSRPEAQIFRALLTDEPAVIVDEEKMRTRVLTPHEARRWDAEHANHLEIISEFVDVYGYRHRAEAVDGSLPAKWWDPAEDYSGIQPA